VAAGAAVALVTGLGVAIPPVSSAAAPVPPGPVAVPAFSQPGASTVRLANGSYETDVTGSSKPAVSSSPSGAASPSVVSNTPGTVSCSINSTRPAATDCQTSSTAVTKVGFDGTTRYRAVEQWSLPPIPQDANVISGDIGLPYTSRTTSGATTAAAYRAYALAKPWNSLVTWNTTNGSTPWTSPGGDVDSSAKYLGAGFAQVLSGGHHVVNATPLVAGWVAQTQENDGIEVRQVGEATNEVVSLTGMTNTTAPPFLRIIWVAHAPQGGISRPLDDNLSLAAGPDGQALLSGKLFNLAGVGIDLPLSYTVGSFAATANAGAAFSFSSTPGGKTPAPMNLAISDVTNGGSLSPNLVFTAANGENYTFEPDTASSNKWISPPGIDATMAGPVPNIVTGIYSPITLTYNKTGVVDHFTQNASGTAGGPALDLTSVTNTPGDTITYTYDTNNQVTSIKDTHGRTTTIVPEAVGSYFVPASLTTPAGRQDTFTYTQDTSTATPLLSTVVDSDGTTIFARSDPAVPDLVTAVTDPVGNITTIAWNSSGGQPVVATESFPIDSKTAVTYSYAYPLPLQTNITDPNGGVTVYVRDTADNVTHVADPLGHTRDATWDANNDPNTYTDGVSAVTHYSYDTLNNLTQTVSGAGSTSKIGYPAPTGGLGDYQPTTSTDGQNNKTTYSYNTSLQLATTATPSGAGGTVTNHYQGDTGISCTNAAKGQLCSTVNGMGNTTSYSYGPVHNPITITNPAPQGPVKMTYDVDSRMVSRTDGNNTTLYYTYNNDDQITQVSTSATTCPAGTCVAYSYNADGQLVTRVDPSGTTTYTYDGEGNDLTKNTPTGATTYTYDGNANLASYADTSGTVTYTYDAANRLTALAEPSGSCPATPTFPNGSKCTGFGYDNANHRTNISYPNGQTITDLFNPSGQEYSITAQNASGVLYTRGYSYLAGSTPTDVRQTMSEQDGNVTSYNYDGVNRIGATATTQPVVTTAWTYDKDGNRLTATGAGQAKYNAADQECYDQASTNTPPCGQAPPGATTNTFDGAGNLTDSSTGITHTTYSPFGQQTSTTTAGVITNETYSDVTNTERTTSGSTSYLNSILGVTQQTSPAGTISFIRDPTGNLIAMHTNDNPNSPNTKGASYYYTTDVTGSVILLTDETGATAATYLYGTYGEPIGQTGPIAATNPYQFQSGYADPNGLTHFGARYYDPATGRWTQLDPTGKNPGYAFAGADPVNNSDPSGTCDGILSCLDSATNVVTNFLGKALPVVGAICGGVNGFRLGLLGFAFGYAGFVTTPLGTAGGAFLGYEYARGGNGGTYTALSCLAAAG
jgi:RHS repeat-associated protein